MKKNIVMTLSAVLLATSLVACANGNATSQVQNEIQEAAPAEQAIESVEAPTIESYEGTSGWSIYYDTSAFTLKEVSDSTRIRLEYNADETGLTYVAYDEANGTNIDEIIAAAKMNYVNAGETSQTIFGNTTGKLFTATSPENGNNITVAVIECNDTFIIAEISHGLSTDAEAYAVAAGYLQEVVDTLNVPEA